MNIDPVTTEVVASRLRETAATMEHALYHSGYSPILRESKDGTAGLTDQRRPRRHASAAACNSTTPPTSRRCRRCWRAIRSTSLRPGDSFVMQRSLQVRQPARARLSCAITPAFHRGELIGFGVSLAHKSDIGGIVPGSSGAAAREIYHDGLLLPPVRFQTAAGHRGIGRGDHRQQQPRCRGRARRSARAGRLHAARRREARRALRRIRPRHRASR